MMSKPRPILRYDIENGHDRYHIIESEPQREQNVHYVLVIRSEDSWPEVTTGKHLSPSALAKRI
jgi:hypothetical protein